MEGRVAPSAFPFKYRFPDYKLPKTASKEILMTSVNCSRCGTMNMPTDQSCFKCGSTLQLATRVDSTQEPYFPHPSHGLANVWRNKSTLVMTKEAMLPGRCVKCNVPTNERLKRKLTWHHPALYLLILASILIYAIVAMVVRKTATVNIGFCPDHLAARKKHLGVTWALGLGCVASFFIAAMFDDINFAFLGIVLILSTAVYGITTLRVVAPTKIDEQLVWLKGVNPEYLQEFPEWRGAR